MPEATFSESFDTAGYWSREAVDAIGRVEIDDLVGRHAAAGIELRTASNLWPLWDNVVASSLEYSGMRLRSALPRPRPRKGAPIRRSWHRIPGSLFGGYRRILRSSR
jgi:hypothetical protein